MKTKFRSHKLANRYFRRYFPRAHFTYRSALDHRSYLSLGMDRFTDGCSNEFLVAYDITPGSDTYAIRLHAL